MVINLMKLIFIMYIFLIKKLEYIRLAKLSTYKYCFLLIIISFPLYAHQKTSLPSAHSKHPCFVLSISSKLTHHELYLSTLKIESRKAGLPWYWITTQQKSLCDSSDTIPQLTIDTQQFHFKYATYLSANDYPYTSPKKANINQDPQSTLLHNAELQAHHVTDLIIHLLLEQKQAAQVQGIPLFDLNDQINQQDLKQLDLKKSQNLSPPSSLLLSKDSSLLPQTNSSRKKLAQSVNKSSFQENSKPTTKRKESAQKSASSLPASSLPASSLPASSLPASSRLKSSTDHSKNIKSNVERKRHLSSQHQAWELQLGACYLYQFSSYLTTGPQLNIYYTPPTLPFQFSTLVSYLISPTTQQEYVSSTLQLTNVMMRVGINLFQSKLSLDVHAGLGLQYRALQANSSAQNTADHSQSNEIILASLALESTWRFSKKYYLAWHAMIESYGSSYSYQWLDQTLYPASHIALGSMIAFGVNL